MPRTQQFPKRCASLVVCLLVLQATPLWGADPVKFFVGFRMEAWKTVHMHDATQAKQHIETLKALSCEVKTAQHDGHTDIQSRTVLWKLLALDSQEQADSWVAWLKQAGFETLHGQKATQQTPATDGQPKEIVEYRLVDWKAQHVHQANKAAEALVIFQALGCEAQKAQHAGHTDISVRCPAWMQVELPSHDAAHAWQKYLNDVGFETKHQH